MFKVEKTEINIKTEKTEKTENDSLSLLETENSTLQKKSIFFTCSSSSQELLQKKKFMVISKYNKAQKDTSDIFKSYGLWDKSEHNKFIEALYLYNCSWKKIQKHLNYRTYKQIRSHGQKFYLKLKSFHDEELGLDFTSPYVKNLKDIMQIIREKESTNENCAKLLYIISEKISFGKNIHQGKINKKFVEKRRKTQIINYKCKNDSINSTSNNKKNNNINDINFDDLYIETKDCNQILNAFKFDNLLFNNIEEDLDHIYTVNNDIKKELIFLLTIIS